MAQLLKLLVNGETNLKNTTTGTTIKAASFIKTGSSDDYLLLGGGGHVLKSSLLNSQNPLASGALTIKSAADIKIILNNTDGEKISTISWRESDSEYAWLRAANDGSFVTKTGTLLTNNILYEANLKWGGRNFSGAYGCIDAAMISDLGANRFAFADPSGITVEYSTDAGATWKTYECTIYDKLALTSCGGRLFRVSGRNDNDGSAMTDDSQLRIIFDTSKCKIYTILNKFCLFVSTGGSLNSTVSIYKALQSDPENYTPIVENVGIHGWPGYNIINIPETITYGNNPSSQYGRIKFVFKQKVSADCKIFGGLNISKIFGFGGVGYVTPSTMASNGHLYSYDLAQNAKFPAHITSKGFKMFNHDSSVNILTADGGFINKTDLAKDVSTILSTSYFKKSVINSPADWKSVCAEPLSVGRTETETTDFIPTQYAPYIVYGMYDTYGCISSAYSSPIITFSGGTNNKTAPNWAMTIKGAKSTTYDLSTFATQSWVTNQKYLTSYTDTKNTAGSTNSTDKLFLIGATSQTTSSQTYSKSGLYCTSTGDLTCVTITESSDIRKKDILSKSLNSSILNKFINDIDIVKFKFKDDEDSRTHIGVIAQEVENYFPELVHTDSDGFKSVEYSKFGLLALDIIKEQQKEIDALKSKMLLLEKYIK